MQSVVFNQAQQELINVMSCLHTDEDVAELKKVLVRFLNERLQHEIDHLWDQGVLSQEKMDEYKTEHLRTPYK